MREIKTTMMLLLLLLPLSISTATQTPPALNDTSAQNQVERVLDVKVIGFSRDEQLCAIALQVEKTYANGNIDRYHLVEVWKISAKQKPEIFNRYRLGELQQYNRLGQKNTTTKITLEQSPSLWRQSLPQKTWLQLQKSADFTAIQHLFEDDLLRLKPDGDSDVRLDVKNHRIHIESMSQAFGYTPIIRLFDGKYLSLGHYRQQSAQKTLKHVQLQMYYSRQGRAIVLLHRVNQQQQQGHTQIDFFYTSEQNPVGSGHLHSLKIIDWQAKHMSQLYKGSHEKNNSYFDTYVGPSF